jgi:hypothetical protein
MEGIIDEEVKFCCINNRLQYAKKCYLENVKVFEKFDNAIWEYYFHLSCVNGNTTIAKWILQIKPSMNNSKIHYVFHKCHYFCKRKAIIWTTQLLPKNVWHYHNDKTKKTKWQIYTKKQQIAKQM